MPPKRKKSSSEEETYSTVGGRRSLPSRSSRPARAALRDGSDIDDVINEMTTSPLEMVIRESLRTAKKERGLKSDDELPFDLRPGSSNRTPKAPPVSVQNTPSAGEVVVKKKRGRPRKNPNAPTPTNSSLPIASAPSSNRRASNKNVYYGKPYYDDEGTDADTESDGSEDDYALRKRSQRSSQKPAQKESEKVEKSGLDFRKLLSDANAAGPNGLSTANPLPDNDDDSIQFQCPIVDISKPSTSQTTPKSQAKQQENSEEIIPLGSGDELPKAPPKPKGPLNLQLLGRKRTYDPVAAVAALYHSKRAAAAMSVRSVPQSILVRHRLKRVGNAQSVANFAARKAKSTKANSSRGSHVYPKRQLSQKNYDDTKRRAKRKAETDIDHSSDFDSDRVSLPNIRLPSSKRLARRISLASKGETTASNEERTHQPLRSRVCKTISLDSKQSSRSVVITAPEAPSISVEPHKKLEKRRKLIQTHQGASKTDVEDLDDEDTSKRKKRLTNVILAPTPAVVKPNNHNFLSGFESDGAALVVPRKRGRPPKKKPTESVAPEKQAHAPERNTFKSYSIRKEQLPAISFDSKQTTRSVVVVAPEAPSTFADKKQKVAKARKLAQTRQRASKTDVEDLDDEDTLKKSNAHNFLSGFESDGADLVVRRKRGRPPKKKPGDPVAPKKQAHIDDEEHIRPRREHPPVHYDDVKRRAPRKKKNNQGQSEGESEEEEEEEENQQVKRRSPRKKQPEDDLDEKESNKSNEEESEERRKRKKADSEVEKDGEKSEKEEDGEHKEGTLVKKRSSRKKIEVDEKDGAESKEESEEEKKESEKEEPTVNTRGRKKKLIEEDQDKEEKKSSEEGDEEDEESEEEDKEGEEEHIKPRRRLPNINYDITKRRRSRKQRPVCASSSSDEIIPRKRERTRCSASSIKSPPVKRKPKYDDQSNASSFEAAGPSTSKQKPVVRRRLRRRFAQSSSVENSEEEEEKSEQEEMSVEKPKRGRPPKIPSASGSEEPEVLDKAEQPVGKPKRGRPPKMQSESASEESEEEEKAMKKPKRGRPPKGPSEPRLEESIQEEDPIEMPKRPSKVSTESESEHSQEETGLSTSKQKPLIRRKLRQRTSEILVESSEDDEEEEEKSEQEEMPVEKPKRGRPPKVRSESESEEPEKKEEPVKKPKRGRPPKQPTKSESKKSEEDDDEEPVERPKRGRPPKIPSAPKSETSDKEEILIERPKRTRPPKEPFASSSEKQVEKEKSIIMPKLGRPPKVPFESGLEDSEESEEQEETVKRPKRPSKMLSESESEYSEEDAGPSTSKQMPVFRSKWRRKPKQSSESGPDDAEKEKMLVERLQRSRPQRVLFVSGSEESEVEETSVEPSGSGAEQSEESVILIKVVQRDRAPKGPSESSSAESKKEEEPVKRRKRGRQRKEPSESGTEDSEEEAGPSTSKQMPIVRRKLRRRVSPFFLDESSEDDEEEEENSEQEEMPVKKPKRGRPPKMQSESESEESEEQEEPVKKPKRGRPPKIPSESVSEESEELEEAEKPVEKPKRGRPPKVPAKCSSEESEQQARPVGRPRKVPKESPSKPASREQVSESESSSSEQEGIRARRTLKPVDYKPPGQRRPRKAKEVQENLKEESEESSEEESSEHITARRTVAKIDYSDVKRRKRRQGSEVKSSGENEDEEAEKSSESASDEEEEEEIMEKRASRKTIENNKKTTVTVKKAEKITKKSTADRLTKGKKKVVEESEEEGSSKSLSSNLESSEIDIPQPKGGRKQGRGRQTRRPQSSVGQNNYFSDNSSSDDERYDPKILNVAKEVVKWVYIPILQEDEKNMKTEFKKFQESLEPYTMKMYTTYNETEPRGLVLNKEEVRQGFESTTVFGLTDRVPVHYISTTQTGPRMKHWIHLEHNVRSKDSLRLSHIPYIDDNHDSVAFVKDLKKAYPEGIHGTLQGWGKHISDYLLFCLLREAMPIWQKYGHDINYLYQAIYKLFPNKMSARQLQNIYPSLEVRFQAVLKPLEQPKKDDVGHSIRTMMCVKCMQYHCLLHGMTGEPFRMHRKPPPKKMVQFPCGSDCYLYLPQVELDSPDTDEDEPFIKQIKDLKINPEPFQKHDIMFQKLVQINRHTPCQISQMMSHFEKKTCQEVYVLMQNPKPPDREMSPDDTMKRKLTMKEVQSSFRNFTWNLGQGRVDNSEQPQACKHSGPCGKNMKDCACGQRDTLCFKYCSCGIDCKMRFPGCRCQPGQCRTKQCQCFYAKWECDPDVCKTCNCGPIHDVKGPEQPLPHFEGTQIFQGDDQTDWLEQEKQEENLPVCCNINLQRGNYKKLKVGKSDIAGYGCFVQEVCEKGEFVAEYTGEVISQYEAERRGRIYDEYKTSYIFALNNDHRVDATRMGNHIRFANHSDSDANCYSQIIMVNGEHRIGIFAKRKIFPREELLFDYQYNKKWKAKYCPIVRGKNKEIEKIVSSSPDAPCTSRKGKK